MAGLLSVLNVGKGDFRMELDPEKPEEYEQGKQMIQRMLQDGYVLAVEMPDGSFKRVKRFNAKRNVYVVQGTPKEQPAEVAAATSKVRAVARSAGGCARGW